MIAEYELSRESDERLYVLKNEDGVCPLHFHRKIELMYVLSGTKKITCGDKHYVLKANQIFVADSYALHGYEKSDDSKQIIIVLPNHMLKDYYLLYGNKKLKSCLITDQDFALALKPNFINISRRNPSPLVNLGNVDIMMGKIVEVLGLVDRDAQFSQNIIEQVLAYINDNYKEELNLESLADHFGYSKYYFSRIFNNFLQTNLTNYLSMVRIQATLDNLRKEKMTVSEAALDAGFSSIQTFYRALKKNYKYNSIKELISENKDEDKYYN